MRLHKSFLALGMLECAFRVVRRPHAPNATVRCDPLSGASLLTCALMRLKKFRSVGTPCELYFGTSRCVFSFGTPASTRARLCVRAFRVATSMYTC